MEMRNHTASGVIRGLKDHGRRAVAKQRQRLPIFRPDAFAGHLRGDDEHAVDFWKLKFVRRQGERADKTEARRVHMKGLASRLLPAWHGGERQGRLRREDLIEAATSCDQHVDVLQVDPGILQGLLSRLGAQLRHGLRGHVMAHGHTAVFQTPPLGQAVSFFDDV